MRRSFLTLLLCASMLTALSGCLKTFHLTLRPNADGSGTLDYTVVLKESTIAMLKEARNEPDSINAENHGVGDQIHRIADSSKGVLRFDHVQFMTRQGDTIGATATYRFDDISKLQMQSLFRTPDMGTTAEEDSSSAMWTAFEFSKGTPSVLGVHSRKADEFLKFSGVFYTPENPKSRRSSKKSHQDDHLTNPFAMMIADMLDSLDMQLEMIPRGTIVSTNAMHRTNNGIIFAKANLSGLKDLMLLRERNPAKAQRREQSMIKSFIIEKTPVVEIRFND